MKIVNVLMLSGALVAMGGCASKVVQTTEYSGYLKDYSNLEQVKTPSGAANLRWADASADLTKYKAIYIKPTVFYPEAKPTDKVDMATLNKITWRADKSLARELGKVKPLVQKPGPGVLVIAPAITAVTANKESFKPYEVLPIALVASSVNMAAGGRDEDSNLYVETLVSDGATNKPVVKSVRKIRGETLENSKTKINGSTFDEAIDQAAVDAALMFRK